MNIVEELFFKKKKADKIDASRKKRTANNLRTNDVSEEYRLVCGCICSRT